MPHEDSALIVLVTFPDSETAASVVGQVVKDKLAACGNIVPTVRSIYMWEGEVQDDPEALAVLKTTAEVFEALKNAIVKAHPYDVPEVIATPITKGSAPYLDWVREMVRT